MRSVCTVDDRAGRTLPQSRVTRNRRGDITKEPAFPVSCQWSLADSQREEGGYERAIASRQLPVAQTPQLPNEGNCGPPALHGPPANRGDSYGIEPSSTDLRSLTDGKHRPAA
jgi:hypothetical protein